jgi:hypothetical protein
VDLEKQTISTEEYNMAIGEQAQRKIDYITDKPQNL